MNINQKKDCWTKYQSELPTLVHFRDPRSPQISIQLATTQPSDHTQDCIISRLLLMENQNTKCASAIHYWYA